MVTRGLPSTTAFAILVACSNQASLAHFDEAQTRALAGNIDEIRLLDDVVALYSSHLSDQAIDCGSICNANSLVHQLSHDATRSLVKRRLETLGYAVQEQIGPAEPVELVNILAELPGKSHPEEIVLLNAHYDAYYGGADDNSTGTAALLELARALRQFEFDRTVRFAFFDLEELGCRGASHYAETHPLENHRVVLVLDSLGNRNTEPGSQPEQFGIPWPSVGDFLLVQANEPANQQAAELELLNQRLSLTKLYSVIAQGDGAYPLTSDLLNGDQIPFWMRNARALNLSDSPCCRDHRMHSPRDVPEAIDGEFLTNNVRLVAAASAYCAGVLP